MEDYDLPPAQFVIMSAMLVWAALHYFLGARALRRELVAARTDRCDYS
jgi:hypothetical protein